MTSIEKNNPKILFPLMITTILTVVLILLILLVFKGSGKRAGEEKARYLSEVGLNRAMWYLNTPQIQGGRGVDWRTKGLTEKFNPGTYLIIVEEGSASGEVVLTSIGSFSAYSRTSKQVLVQDQLLPFFDYALYSGSSVRLEKGSQIFGDVYARGSVNIDFPSKVENGYVYVNPGYVVSGSGDYLLGQTNIASPVLTINSDFYDNKISDAMTNKESIKGDQKYSDLDASKDIYFNGNLGITGHIAGSGHIIVAKDIKIKNAVIHGDPKIICGGNMEIESSSSSDKNFLVFCTKDIYIRGNSSLKGTLIVKSGKLVSDGDVIVYGLIYCVGKGVELHNKIKIYGSVVTSRLDLLTNDVLMDHDKAYFPDTPPMGLAADILNKKPN